MQPTLQLDSSGEANTPVILTHSSWVSVLGLIAISATTNSTSGSDLQHVAVVFAACCDEVTVDRKQPNSCGKLANAQNLQRSQPRQWEVRFAIYLPPSPRLLPPFALSSFGPEGGAAAVICDLRPGTGPSSLPKPAPTRCLPKVAVLPMNSDCDIVNIPDLSKPNSVQDFWVWAISWAPPIVSNISMCHCTCPKLVCVTQRQ